MQEYTFQITADDDRGVPFGPVNKDNMDISRLIIDFTCWLDPSESITQLEHLLISSEPPALLPPWRANYPLDETSSTVVLEDLYPLEFYRNNLLQGGRAVALDMASGTPGMTYVVSFVATAGVSLRRREVDTLLTIDRPFNPLMVGLAPTIPTYSYPLFITMTTALPLGFGSALAGRVYINNQTGAPMTVTLPPSPLLGDRVSVLDYGRSAGFYPVTFIGAVGSEPIGGLGGDHLLSDLTGDDIKFEWTGIYWAVGTNHYGYLG